MNKRGLYLSYSSIYIAVFSSHESYVTLSQSFIFKAMSLQYIIDLKMYVSHQLVGLWRQIVQFCDQENEIYKIMVLTASINDLEMKSAQLKQGLHFANHRRRSDLGSRDQLIRFGW